LPLSPLLVRLHPLSITAPDDSIRSDDLLTEILHAQKISPKIYLEKSYSPKPAKTICQFYVSPVEEWHFEADGYRERFCQSSLSPPSKIYY